MRHARLKPDYQDTWPHCYNRVVGTRDDRPFDAAAPADASPSRRSRSARWPGRRLKTARRIRPKRPTYAPQRPESALPRTRHLTNPRILPVTQIRPLCLDTVFLSPIAPYCPERPFAVIVVVIVVVIVNLTAQARRQKGA